MYCTVQVEKKENISRNIYTGRNEHITFSQMAQKPLQFSKKQHKKHPNKPQQNIYTDNAQISTPQKANISFGTILQNSKKLSTNGKSNNYGTERRDERESSISKLKDKLFGMKKVISEKS